MNWLDILILILVLTSVFTSFKKGMTREIVAIVSVLAGLMLGIWFYGTAAAYLLPYVSSKGMANFCGFLIVFSGVWLLGTLVSYLLSRLMNVTGFSFVDRMLGVGFGLVRGALLSVALVMAIMAFAPGDKPPNAVVHSRFGPYAVEAARVFAAMAPHELKEGFRKSYDQAKTLWHETLKKGMRELPKTEKVQKQNEREI